jgi:proteasome assembly chaperone (PAC2) family protein
VGKMAVDYLIEQLKPTKFAELYSTHLSLPDGDVGIKVELDGTYLLPKYEFYAYTKKSPHIIFLTGDVQPRVWGQYEVAEYVLDYVTRLGCETVVALGGYGSQSRDLNVIYAVGSDQPIVEDLKKREAVTAQSGTVKGALGVILGLGKERLMKCMGLLGATRGAYPDLHASRNVVRLLADMYSLPLSMEGIDKEITDMDARINLLRNISSPQSPQEKTDGREPSRYIS